MHLPGYCGLCRLHIGRLAALCSCAVAPCCQSLCAPTKAGCRSGYRVSSRAWPRYWQRPVGLCRRCKAISTAATLLRARRSRAVTVSPRGLSSRMPLVLFQPNCAPKTKVLGVAFGHGRNTTEADISVSPRGTELGRSDSVSGFTDLYPLYAIIIFRPLRLLPEDFLLSTWQGCGRAADNAIGPGSRAENHRR